MHKFCACLTKGHIQNLITLGNLFWKIRKYPRQAGAEVFFHISSYLVKIRLPTRNQLPWVPGRVVNVIILGVVVFLLIIRPLLGCGNSTHYVSQATLLQFIRVKHTLRLEFVRDQPETQKYLFFQIAGPGYKVFPDSSEIFSKTFRITKTFHVAMLQG